MTDPTRPGEPGCRQERRPITGHGSIVLALLLAAMLGVSPAPASAQSSLQDLSLEDLMQIDAGQVFGASERLQPVTEAPASVTFITSQEIARYGYRTLADILRGVRGIYVTNDRNYSYLGIRGFGKPGDYNSRILLLVNGHRVNDNIYGQAEIGAEFGLDPAMYERVEIIRGPASSLYGDSAFFAVVNVITRSGASLNGASLTAESGTLGTQLVRASGGKSLPNGVDVAVSGTFERSDGVDQLYFPAYDSPATNNGIAQGLDGEGIKQLYGRLIFKDLAITAAYGSRQRDVPTASNGSWFNQQLFRQETTDRHTLLDAYYGRSFRGTRLTLRASYDRFTYDATFPVRVEPDGTPTSVGLTDGLGSRWSVSTGLTRTFAGRQTIRLGSEFIDNLHQNQLADFIGAETPVFDIKHSSKQHAFYAQDEVKLRRWLIVNAGLRYDGYEQFVKVTPRIALIVLPSSTQSFKYLFGSAFRAPSESELNTFYFGEQVTGLRPESIDTHEFVWERYINDRVRTSLSAYWYKADRLITPTVDESTYLQFTYVNQGQVRAKGLELETQIRLRGESRALVSYALQKAVDQQTQEELPNSPHHVIKARLSLQGPTPHSFISFEGQYLSRRATIPQADRADGFVYPTQVAGSATLNMSIIQPLGRAWELSGTVRNIFDTEYSDPVSVQHQQGAIPQNGRTARIGLTWKLWQP